MNKNYGLYFTKGFITLTDELLIDSYSNELKREDFIHLFYILDRGRLNNSNAIELPSTIRNQFGSYGSTGKQVWKFPKLVKMCIDKNIIFDTTYSNYAGANYCKSYGFTQDFINKILDIEIEFQFCEISEKTYKIINRYYKPPTDPILLKHFNTISNLEIDLNKATTFAKTLNDIKFLRVSRDISNIYNKDRILVIQDDRTKRLFTSFNMMKKELRSFCSFNGEQLISIDLKSSQPYLLASILLNKNPNNSEVKSFYELITKEDLYDWFMKQWNGFNTETYLESREVVKKMFFNYLYKENQGTNSAQVVMMEQFPEVYKLIKDKKRKERIWLTLQKLEADIFITVCNKFVNKGCLSVHDSLYFPQSIEEQVRTELDKRFHLNQLFNYYLK